MLIKNEESMRNLLKDCKKVILCGSKPMLLILLRWFRKEEYLDLVQGISSTATSKFYYRHLGLEDRRLNEWNPKPDTVLLFAVQKEEEKSRLIKRAQRGWSDEQIVDVEYEFLASLSRREHPQFGFLCVGFPKTGTTSLHNALRKNKKIFLPKGKESRYALWKYRYLDAPERFQDIWYPNIPKGKIVGGVEPTYFSKASFVYETFSPDIKIIFMLRDPADAAYSDFKMQMRRNDKPGLEKYYKKYKRYTSKMFQDYMQDAILSDRNKKYQYDIWIKEYLEYYKKEQMMFVIFEEIIREPERVLAEIQEFICGKKGKMVTALPYSNSGKEVSRNYLAYRINRKLLRMEMNRKQDKDFESREQFRKLSKRIKKFTLVVNNEKIRAEDKAELMEFYMESIHATEEFIGRSLRGIWYD